MTPSTSLPSVTTNGVPPDRETLSTVSRTICGKIPPSRSIKTRMASAAPLRMGRADFASAQTKFFLREHDDAAAFGCFVGERGELCGVGETLDGNEWRRNKLRRL